ncbi:hypothetical protein [Rhodanobacter sp. BL-MT-08]
MANARFVLFAIVLLTTACAGLSQRQTTYSGDYFYNFEYASFFPDGKDVRWCVNGDMSKAELPAKDANGPWGTSHVIVQGTLGSSGHYGNLGACKRILTVTKILKVSNMRARE